MSKALKTFVIASFLLQSQLHFSFWEGCATATAVIGWRSCLSWVTTIFMSSVCVICRVLFCLACVSGVLFFLKRWKFFKNNFSFGSALQALLKTLVVCWLVRFLIVLANCVGYIISFSTESLISFAVNVFKTLAP